MTVERAQERGLIGIVIQRADKSNYFRVPEARVRAVTAGGRIPVIIPDLGDPLAIAAVSTRLDSLEDIEGHSISVPERSPPDPSAPSAVIGLTMNYVDPEKMSTIQLRQTYPSAVLAAGGAPLLVPLGLDESALRQVFDLMDGLLLPGGLDVEPGQYGEMPHSTTESDPALDTAEFHLVKWGMTQQIPILGICRGQQVLNVALGGTLTQDLDSDQKPGHRQSRKIPRSTVAHALRIEPGSHLADILGTTACEVNTHHHQAIKDLAPGLRATAWGPDGVIEGVEGTSNQGWLVAVQFHPEDMVAVAHEPSQRLFRSFVDACRARTIVSV